jgi:hypothetical protein
MRLTTLLKAGVVAAALVGSAPTVQAQGRVVVSHDEWFTGSGQFGVNEQQFVTNVMNWFGASSGNSILIYSNNTFLTNANFVNWLSGKGFSVTVNANAASFSPFHTVLTEGNPNLGTTGAALAAYVLGGGHVLDIGGTGTGGAAAEAAYNNTFLGNFGLNFSSFYNGVGTVNTSTYASQGPFGAALFAGVLQVFANNGNNVITTTPVAGVTTQVWQDSRGNGVFAAAEVVTATPEPATMALLGTGLMGLAPFARRRRRNK